MTKLTTLDLSPLYRTTIGMDRLFDRIMNQIDHSAASNYPPYNIVRTGENTVEIQVAVAGFSEGELSVEVCQGELRIAGEKQQDPWPDEAYQYRGISARRFARVIPLAANVEVISATSRNGILAVQLEHRVPEALKPKTIGITFAQ
jgi:molecular chaperone IbpA